MRRLLLLLPLALLAGCGGSSSSPPAALPTATAIPTPTAIPAAKLDAALVGTVVSAKTGKPIARATVSIGNGSQAVKTDTAGRYKLNIPSGIPTPVVVTARGYTGALAEGKVTPHSVTHYNFKLTPVVAGKPGAPSFPGTFGKP
jgi:hypothetical protein